MRLADGAKRVESLGSINRENLGKRAEPGAKERRTVNSSKREIVNGATRRFIRIEHVEPLDDASAAHTNEQEPCPAEEDDQQRGLPPTQELRVGGPDHEDDDARERR